MPFASYPSPYAAYGGTAAPMQGVPQPVLVPGSGASQSMGSTSTNTGASYGTVGYQPNNNQFNQKSSNGSKNSDSNSNVGSSDSKNSSVSRSGYSSTQQQSNLVPVQCKYSSFFEKEWFESCECCAKSPKSAHLICPTVFFITVQ